MRMPMRSLLLAASQIPPGAPPGRYWLEALHWIVPGPAATRWLLLADAAVLLLVAARWRRPLVAAAVALGGGFLALNVVSLLLTDFFLGLASFHVLTGVVGLVAAGRARWAGAALLALALAVGVLT
jgi:hypothetical protein